MQAVGPAHDCKCGHSLALHRANRASLRYKAEAESDVNSVVESCYLEPATISRHDSYLVPCLYSPSSGHLEPAPALAAGLGRKRLPQVLLVTGPAGVGKQRLALWLAPAASCASAGRRSPADECRSLPAGRRAGASRTCTGSCRSPAPRRRIRTRQIEEAAEAMAEVMEERRAKPLYGAAGRHGQPLDGIGPAAPPARGADVGRRWGPGVHHRRCRAAGPAGGEPGGGERAAQAAGGAAGRDACSC